MKVPFVDLNLQCDAIRQEISAAITERTKALMPVHLYGQMADMDAIMSIATQHRYIPFECEILTDSSIS